LATLSILSAVRLCAAKSALPAHENIATAASVNGNLRIA
jgi:hypothetical protein